MIYSTFISHAIVSYDIAMYNIVSCDTIMYNILYHMMSCVSNGMP